MGIRKFFYNWYVSSLFLSTTAEFSFFQNIFYLFCKHISFFCNWFPIEISLNHPCCYVRNRIGTVNPNTLQKRFLPALNMQILQLFHALFLQHKSYLQDHLKTPYQEPLYPEYRRLSYQKQQNSAILLTWFNLQLLAITYTTIQIFTLRKKRIFGRFYSF